MIYLISPSNYFLTPYLDNYIKIIKNNDLDYRLIYWDRLNVNEDVENSIIYSDDIRSISKSRTDYLRYLIFIKRNLKLKKEDKLILFSIQMIPLLFMFSTKSYIIDIRDYHKLSSLKIIQNKIKKAKMLVISSPKFKEFINNTNILLNHNFNMNAEVEKDIKTYSTQLNISTIGAIRDLQENINLIEIFKNDKNFKLSFNGEGGSSEDLKKYCAKMDILNVEFTGRYDKEEEETLYKNSHFISLVRNNDIYNNQIALPNRLYKAAKYNIPIVTNAGSLLADIVDKYNIGVIIDDKMDNITIKRKIKEFNRGNLMLNQKMFLKEIIEDNNLYKKSIKKFLEN